MEATLSFSYDSVGDTIYIQSGPPYEDQYSVLENGVVIRRHPETREIERVEVMGFRRRTLAELAELPIPENFRALLLTLVASARAATAKAA